MMLSGREKNCGRWWVEGGGGAECDGMMAAELPSHIVIILTEVITNREQRISLDYFHERFIFDALSIIHLTIMCSSLENTCPLTSLCHVICSPRYPYFIPYVQYTVRVHYLRYLRTCTIVSSFVLAY